jgi:hypothetical protein
MIRHNDKHVEAANGRGVHGTPYAPHNDIYGHHTSLRAKRGNLQPHDLRKTVVI